MPILWRTKTLNITTIPNDHIAKRGANYYPKMLLCIRLLPFLPLSFIPCYYFHFGTTTSYYSQLFIFLNVRIHCRCRNFKFMERSWIFKKSLHQYNGQLSGDSPLVISPLIIFEAERENRWKQMKCWRQKRRRRRIKKKGTKIEKWKISSINSFASHKTYRLFCVRSNSTSGPISVRCFRWIREMV